MKQGRLIRTAGQGLDAEIEYDGTVYTVMDGWSIYGEPSPAPSETIRFDFLAGLTAMNETWDDIFQGNPSKMIGIHHISHWKYKAYGKVVSVNPVVIDCGVVQAEDVFRTHDERCIGEYVGFTIEMLGIMRILEPSLSPGGARQKASD